MRYLVVDIHVVSDTFGGMARPQRCVTVQDLILPVPEAADLRGRENEHILPKYQVIKTEI